MKLSLNTRKLQLLA